MLRIAAFAAACLLAAAPAAGLADSYPSKPIRFVVPFPTGNAGDLMARMLAEKLTASMKQSVIVDNRPGAGGNIGAEQVAKSPADGYTVLIAASGIVTANPYLYKLNFDPQKDFTPVTLLYSGAPVLVVSPKVKEATLKDLIEAARRQPGKFTYASYGAGHVSHILGEMFKQAAGIDLLHIPYKSSPLPDVMSGQVDMIFESPLLVVKNTGKLRPLAVVSAKRNPKMPEVPAVAEALPGFEVTGWLGAFVPAGTPPELVQRLYREFAAAIGSPEFRKRLDDLLLDPGGNTPEEFAAYVRAMSERVGGVIRKGNIKVE
ncbi:MAG TPA: tripartite tricarboxylate transporter substrate binding protein [Burkholderiales bacterium]|jgi:tripartite-type tricarboxylate transporter receptor subunit TctC|nr:tripartite tricarboxylate transporter substrate binding protein [Burkholderiales bacterium]